MSLSFHLRPTPVCPFNDTFLGNIRTEQPSLALLICNSGGISLSRILTHGHAAVCPEWRSIRAAAATPPPSSIPFVCLRGRRGISYLLKTEILFASTSAEFHSFMQIISADAPFALCSFYLLFVKRISYIYLHVVRLGYNVPSLCCIENM